MNRSDRIALAITRALIEAYERSPARGKSIALRNLQRMEAQHPEGIKYAHRWRELLDGPVRDLKRRVLADTDEGQVLRSMQPLSGLISAERRRLLLIREQSRV